MKNHSTHRLVALLALLAFTALFFIPLRASAQAEATAWTTKDGTTFWAVLVGLSGKDFILMDRGRDLRVPVNRLSVRSVGKACRELGVPEARLLDIGASPVALPGGGDGVEPKTEVKTPLTSGGVCGSVPRKCKAAAPVAGARNSSVRPASRVAGPQAGDEPGEVQVVAPAESRDESDSSDLGWKVMEFCRRNLGEKVGNGQCAVLAVEALKSAGAARMGRDFPKRGDYVWGEQVALLEYGRREIAGLESLAKVRPGDIIQFRNVRLEGHGPAGRYGMTADHHTAVVATVDSASGVLTCYHQNWGRKIVRQDRMQLKDLQSGWMRIYRPVAAE
jgi:hypothetical protein